MKYTRAPKKGSSGIASRQIARHKLRTIPLMPYPNMIAPIYLGGSIPPRAKVLDWTIPPKTPKIKRIVISAAKALPDDKAFVIRGRAIIKTAITK